ncbi:MAG: HlyD family efflux transporter periplasmic adaptor subunit [Planctomycetota bacterium]|nr:HlyD family efflux transporter periplasmic adaptor subunit [Planctomycetota bacterium]
MSQLEHFKKPPGVSADEPSPGYGAALLEAVRRQPKAATGFGNPSARGESGPVRAARASSAQAPVTRPTPMPKRPKGRLLIGTFLALVVGFGALTVWNSLFRYQAYGGVTGRVVELSAPWGGVLQTIHVREGEAVRQDQLLATVVNPELDRQVDAKRDELRIAQATLDAQVSELRLQSQLRDDNQHRAVAEYYELWGQLLQEQSTLADMVAKLQRSENLSQQALVPVQKLEELRHDEAGQRSKVEKLSEAVRKLGAIVEQSEARTEELHSQLKPFALRIESIQNEIIRLRESVSLGAIRAPVNGRVIKVHRFTGEYSDPEFPIFDVLVDGSVEAVLYVSQKDAGRFYEGKLLELEVPPAAVRAKCVVVRIADRYEPVPKNIEIHYRRDEKLLPIYARPLEGSNDTAALRLGGEVRLPYSVSNPLKILNEFKAQSQ